MKTTIDLPTDLVRSLKLRALHEGKTIQALAAEILRPVSVGNRAASRVARPGRKLVAKNLPTIAARLLEGGPVLPQSSWPLSAQEMNDWLKQRDLDLEAEHHEETVGR